MNTLQIIKREEWKAQAAKQPYVNIFPDSIVIHHYGGIGGKPRKESSKYFRGHSTIKNLQSKHIYNLGLIDIKYHFIITKCGLVYEGRPIGVAGCHCKKNDNHTIAILFFGNYNVEEIEKEQLRSFMLLLKHIKEKYRHLDIPRCIKNHRDYEHTLCPGHHLSNLINIIKLRKWNL